MNGQRHIIRSLPLFMKKNFEKATAILNIDRENKNPEKTLQNGAIFLITSAICMMKPLHPAMN